MPTSQKSNIAIKVKKKKCGWKNKGAKLPIAIGNYVENNNK